ncbi:MAG: hypothetical protein KC776_40455 [Myxococcales bacterium]|nr:hypothetical protein [Myxococcales bacterium]
MSRAELVLSGCFGLGAGGFSTPGSAGGAAVGLAPAQAPHKTHNKRQGRVISKL